MESKKTFIKIIFLAIFITPLLANSQENLFEWSIKTGGNIQSSVKESEGILYVGSFDSIFYAIDTLGTEKWQYNSHYSIQSSALIFDSVVCFQSGNRLFGLNKTTGEQIWLHEPTEVTEKEPVIMVDDIDLKDASPVLNDSVAYYGNEYGKFYGVDLISGEQVFVFDTEKGYSINSTAAFTTDTAYFGDMEGYIYAVNVSTGNLLWQVRTNDGQKPYGGFGPIIGNLVVNNDLLYFGLHNGELQILNRFTGETEWTTGNKFGTWYSGIPVINNDVLYMGTSDTKKLEAFNSATGDKLWSASIQHGIYNAPILYNNLIVVIGGYSAYEMLAHESGTGRLVILDMDGNVLNAISLKGSVFNTPELVNGKLYFGSMDDHIYCLNLEKLVNNAQSNFIFSDESIENVELTTVDTYDIDFGYLTNNGNMSDNFSFSFGDLTFDNKGIKVLPESGSVNGFDSVKIKLSIRPRHLDNGTYTTSVQLKVGELDEIVVERLISFRVNKGTGVDDTGENQNKLNIYPNPFKNEINYNLNSYPTSNLKIDFYNAEGKQLTSKTLTEKEGTIYLNNISNDNQLLYYKLVKDNQEKASGKIIQLK